MHSPASTSSRSRWRPLPRITSPGPDCQITSETQVSSNERRVHASTGGTHKKDDLQWILSEKSHLNIGEFITDRQEHASGLGASCDVFSAWSEKHKKKVAVKRIRAFLLEDKKFAKVSSDIIICLLKSDFSRCYERDWRKRFRFGRR